MIPHPERNGLATLCTRNDTVEVECTCSCVESTTTYNTIHRPLRRHPAADEPPLVSLGISRLTTWWGVVGYGGMEFMRYSGI